MLQLCHFVRLGIFCLYILYELSCEEDLDRSDIILAVFTLEVVLAAIAFRSILLRSGDLAKNVLNELLVLVDVTGDSIMHGIYLNIFLKQIPDRKQGASGVGFRLAKSSCDCYFYLPQKRQW
jgi:hypothetical protein